MATPIINPWTLTGTLREKIITDFFIPQIKKATVATAMLTTETGLKTKSIKVWGVGAVAISDYTGGRITNQHNYTNTSVDLVLDQAKSFSEDISRLENEASAINVLPGVLEAGAQGIAESIDAFAFAQLATTTEEVATIVLDETNAIDWLLSMKTKLTKLGAPTLGRKLAVTPEAGAIFSKVISASGSDSLATEAGLNGAVGHYGGFDIYESDFLADGANGKYAIASVQRGGALGIGFNELGVDAIPGSPIDNAWTVVQYGCEVVQPKFIVKSDIKTA